MTCFACVPRDHLTQPRRVLCLTHKAQCEFADGTPVASALARAAPEDGQLEGSLLGFLFNPVFIVDATGTRRAGWADFAGGGMAVYEAGSPTESPLALWLAVRDVSLAPIHALVTSMERGGSLSELHLDDDEWHVAEETLDAGRRLLTIAARRQRLGRWPASYAELTALLRVPPDESTASADAILLVGFRQYAANLGAASS